MNITSYPDRSTVIEGSPEEILLYNKLYEEWDLLYGNSYPRTKQVARCGNSVPPPFATALVRANAPEWCGRNFKTMKEFIQEVAI